MNLQIREAVTENVIGEDSKGFSDMINDAIQRGEEHLLPGLGVLLETWWNSTEETKRSEFTKALEKAFQSSKKA